MAKRAAFATLLFEVCLAGSVYPAVIASCTVAQELDYSTTYGGVISFTGYDVCLCSQPGDNAGALTFQECDGPGVGLHDREIGYNATLDGGPIPKAGTGLCVTASGGDVVLSSCSGDPANQDWQYSTSTKKFSLTSNASQCLAVGSAPPPLVSNVFGDHMVLQRGAPAKLWGWTTPGGSVLVSVVFPAGQQYNVTSSPAGSDGRWTVSLTGPSAPYQPGQAGANITVTDLGSGEQATLVDVLFGDVRGSSARLEGRGEVPGDRQPSSHPAAAAAAAGDLVLGAVQHERRQHPRGVRVQRDR